MLFPSLILCGLVASEVMSRPLASAFIPEIDTTGFLNPSISYSAGGHAICVGGLVPIEVSTSSAVKLQLPDQINQFASAQLLVDAQALNSTTASELAAHTTSTTQAFNISSRLCYPQIQADLKRATTVQFLTHGIGFSKTYWDFAAPDNSYIDAAALAGKVTFSYDRLGIDKSTRPDPIQIVQGPTEIAVAHTLITLLRSGELAGTSFKNIIGVGHSYGSAISTSIAVSYPSDFDAVVLTGFATSKPGIGRFGSALNLIPASSSPSGRFPDLADGYLLPSTLSGVQYAFFNFPYLQTDILLQAFATIQTTTWGELLTMASLGGLALQFTKPVFVVDGESDVPFCDGNCSYPVNVPAETLKEAFPNADRNASSTLVLPRSAHGLNLGTTAPVLFSHIQVFISETGL